MLVCCAAKWISYTYIYIYIYIYNPLMYLLTIFGCAMFLLLSGLWSSCGEQGLLSSCSVRVSHCSGFSCCTAWVLGYVGLSSCSSQAFSTGSVVMVCGLSCSAGMWDFPGPGIELMSPALADVFSTTEPSGKPRFFSPYRSFQSTEWSPQPTIHCIPLHSQWLPYNFSNTQSYMYLRTLILVFLLI